MGSSRFAPSDYSAFNTVRFGRRLKGARIMAGFEDARMYAAELRRRGILPHHSISDVTQIVRELESGLWVPSYPLLVMTAALTCPPGGRAFFEEAFDPETQRALAMLSRMEP